MIPFEIVEARSLREAAALLDPEDASVRPIAGGTALMLMMKAGVFRPTRLVSLRLVRGFSEIQVDADGRLRVGALTPLAILERSRDVQRVLPVIGSTLRVLSNVRVRNVATGAAWRMATRTWICRRSSSRSVQVSACWGATANVSSP